MDPAQRTFSTQERKQFPYLNLSRYLMVFDAKRFVWCFSGNYNKKHDILADEWSKMPDTTVERYFPNGCLVGDRFIYLFGGCKDVTSCVEVLTFERIDTRDPDATWSPVVLASN